MKQHLAKSLLMAGAMLASYPLFAQPTQPMPATQPMQSIQPAAPAAQPMQGAQAIQAAPAATSPAAGAMPAGGNTYAQTAGQPSMAPVPVDPTVAGGAGQGIDPASMRLAPDALGTRLGQRSPFLDGA
ncbi:hypothetical protein LMG23992_01061 [Cupriavidus laharis]|uniref:Uncharacterized protein n=1 Tax=Cupriavidus laharis TaxID=151654 RepID=A0ABM8WLG6_9BURK|nr:hypothetical protein [Cupriavidus laharis]CAG9168229.1 hypothetical protein LMG23992_01061 [Cupriavidus laharis]